MPQVSVIIPLYNKGRYIRRALDSVCAQTFTDFECVVVDDGSTDDGPEIVKTYNDPRIHLIRQENAGPGAARNRGARESASTYLAFLDADDEWLPDFLKLSVEALESHPECTVSVTSRYEGLSRTDITPRLTRQGLLAGVWLLDVSDDVHELANMRSIFSTGTVVCRRRIFDSFGGFYEKTRVISGEDTYLWLQLLVNCKIFVILQPLAWYHIEASGLSCQWYTREVVQPYLLNPDPIRRNCPSENVAILEKLLTGWAFARAEIMCVHQDVEAAREICRKFPAMRQSLWRYAKLRIKISFPRAYRTFIWARVNSWVSHREGNPRRNDSVGVPETECPQEDS